MTEFDDHKSGKGAGDENFPVASRLIAPALRAPILAYYRFARSADDAADHPQLSQSEKFRRLDALEETLVGKSDAASDALPLRQAIAERGLSPRHALDLLVAFRQDVTKSRYASWDELMHYCRYSAAPVGRFVLDAHGESAATYPYSDALCTALQVINHIQDCGKDYRTIDRVYMPLDMLAVEGASVDMLGAKAAKPELLRALRNVAGKTNAMTGDAQRLPAVVADRRLGLETSVIAGLAGRLLDLLAVRDPLSQNVHFSKPAALAVAMKSAISYSFSRAFAGKFTPSFSVGGDR